LAAIVRGGFLVNQVALLMLTLAIVTITNHVMAMMLLRAKARRFATEQPQASTVTVLALESRRLRDYTSLPVEIAIFTAHAIVFGPPPFPANRNEFAVPLLSLYLQAGLLLIKHALVMWRSPLPARQAESYFQLLEQRRRYVITACDVMRGIWTVAL